MSVLLADLAVVVRVLLEIVWFNKLQKFDEESCPSVTSLAMCSMNMSADSSHGQRCPGGRALPQPNAARGSSMDSAIAAKLDRQCQELEKRGRLIDIPSSIPAFTAEEP